MSTPMLWAAVGRLLAIAREGRLPSGLAQSIDLLATNGVTLVDGSEVTRIRDTVRQGVVPTEVLQVFDAREWLRENRLLRCPWERALVFFPVPGRCGWFTVSDCTALAGGYTSRSFVLVGHETEEIPDDIVVLPDICFTIANFREESVAQVTPNRAARKQAPAVAGLTFSAISIQFMREVVARVHERHPNARESREHLVRGHIAFYTKPIGGRPNGFVGPVWKPPHVRGSAEHGRVVKDYVVAPIHPPQ